MTDSKSSDERESELESQNPQAKRTEQVELAEFFFANSRSEESAALY